MRSRWVCQACLQPRKEKVGASEQQHLRHWSVASRQCGKVLADNRFEQRRDDLVDSDPRLQQGVGVRFGEDPAFARDFVKRVSLVAHFGELLERDTQLPCSLLDKRPGPP